MNDNFDSPRYTRGTAGTIPAAPSERASRLSGTLLKFLRALSNHGRNALAGLRGQPASAFLRRHWAFAVFLSLLLFPLAGVLVGYLSRPGGSSSGAAAGITIPADTGERQAKPSPGKSRLPESKAPPPVVVHPVFSSAVEPQTPPSMTVPPRPLTPAPATPTPIPSVPPPAPAVASNAPYTPMVYPARHDKIFGEGCAGQLTLDTNGLAFRCPDDPQASLQVALGDIQSVDGNGVRLISGKKYHFSIAGMGRSNAEQLFDNWLSRVR